MIKTFLLLLMLVTGCIAQAQSSGVPSPLPASIKIGISNDTYPYMFVDEKGQAAGLVVDYWQEIARQHDIEVEFIAADWAETLTMLDAGHIDLHGGLGRTTER
jgi:ABC-type amino acid transport substrate-binding protein